MKEWSLAWWATCVLLCACDAHSASQDRALADAGHEARDAALCDGSDEIRFGFSASGGQVSNDDLFLSPFAYWFWVVRGDCTYLVSTGPSGELRSGELDRSRAAELAKVAGFVHIAEWSRFRDAESCPDAGDVTLHSLDQHATCTCGCGAQAPAGLEDALTAAANAMQDLWNAGQRVPGAVTAVAYTPPGGIGQWPDTLTPQDWPLSSSIDRILVSEPIAVTSSAGERFEQEDATALRALRVKANTSAQFVQSFPVRTEDGVVHALLVRDEPPEPFNSASSFLR